MYSTPLMELVYQAASVHRMYNDPTMVRLRHDTSGLIPWHNWHNPEPYKRHERGFPTVCYWPS